MLQRGSIAATSVCLLMILGAVLTPLNAFQRGSGWVLEDFAGQEETSNITFGNGGGTDTTTHFTLPKDAPVYSAVMTVEGFPDGTGAYPSDVSVDAGGDGDAEWAFTGQGYGNLGRQTHFDDGTEEIVIEFRTDQNPDTAGVMIPAGAVITGASMRVEGRPQSNYGAMVMGAARDSDLTLRASGSTGNSLDPKLTINYVEGGSTVLQPDEPAGKDAAVQKTASNTNFGSHPNLVFPNNQNVRGLIQFDLSGADDEKSVSTAYLDLFATSDATGQSWGIYEILQEWNEGSVTWKNRPSYKDAAEDAINIDFTGDSWVTFNMTVLVRNWIESVPSNVRVDFGDDGNPEYSMQGELTFAEDVEDFTAGLNAYLSSAAPTFTDVYGNPMAEVPVSISSDTSGRLTVSNLSITYKWAAEVDPNPHNGNLTAELSELVSSLPPADDTVDIPVHVSSATAGTVRLGGLRVAYDGPPVLLAEIPDLTVLEDEANPAVLDLWEHFFDDFQSQDELSFEIIHSSPDVDIYVTDNRWVGVKTLSQDYNGDSPVLIAARDAAGYRTESNEFLMSVVPVNDEPVAGPGTLAPMTLQEGGRSIPVLLNGPQQYFTDADEGDVLRFGWEVDPDGMWGEAPLTFEFDEASSGLVVVSEGDFYGAGIPLRIYCDDDDDLSDAIAYQDVTVDVTGLNDAPVWTAIPDLHVTEDTQVPEALALAEFAADVDNGPADLHFGLMLQGNTDRAIVTVDPDGTLGVRPVQDNWTGEVPVTVYVSDRSGDRSEASFTVFIDPVNDLPVVTLLSPGDGISVASETVTLEWSAVDAETPSDELTFDVYASDGGKSEPVARGVRGTSYEMELSDGVTYEWTVVAGDGEEYGRAAPERSFTVDYSIGPKVKLESPSDGAYVTSDRVELTWTSEGRPGGGGGGLEYHLHFGMVMDGLEVLEGGIAATRYTVGGLVEGETYYWSVVPEDDAGTGVCESGIWSFTYDPDFGGYGVGLDVYPDVVKVKPGGMAEFTIVVSNPGVAMDSYKLTVDVPGTGAITGFGSVDPSAIPVESGGETVVKVMLAIPNSTSPGDYRVLVTVKSLGGGQEEERTITARVVMSIDGDDGKASSQPDQILGLDLFILLLILIIVIIFCIVLYGMHRRNRKMRERMAELEGKPPKSLKAELVTPSTLASPALGPGGPRIPGLAGVNTGSQATTLGSGPYTGGAVMPLGPGWSGGRSPYRPSPVLAVYGQQDVPRLHGMKTPVPTKPGAGGAGDDDDDLEWLDEDYGEDGVEEMEVDEGEDAAPKGRKTVTIVKKTPAKATTGDTHTTKPNRQAPRGAGPRSGKAGKKVILAAGTMKPLPKEKTEKEGRKEAGADDAGGKKTGPDTGGGKDSGGGRRAPVKPLGTLPDDI